MPSVNRAKSWWILGVAIAIGLSAALIWQTLKHRSRRGPQANTRQAYVPKKTANSLGDFTLLDQSGVIQMLYRNWDAKAVVIIGQANGCPIVQKYASTIHDFVDRFGPRGIRFFLINANSSDDRASLIKEADAYNFGAPILMDPSQIVSKELGLQRTAEAVVISTANWEVVYRGPIDDRLAYEMNKQTSQTKPLEDALNALLSGKSPAPATFAAKGCAITYENNPAPSFKNVIAPILKERCLNCHGGAGPFPPVLDSHAKIKSWAAMIRESLFTDRMPPFSADSHYGKFSNDISLSPLQKSLLVSWIDAGLPNDAPADPLAGTYGNAAWTRKFLKSNRPIYSANMSKPADIPPDGELEYKYFQLGDAIPEDMWITAFYTSSTNPRQLHHESLMIVPKPLSYYERKSEPLRNKKFVEENVDGDIPIYTLQQIMAEAQNDPHFLRTQIWAAGRPAVKFAGPGAMYFLPKGYYLILETHYMGTGKRETELTKIDFFGSRVPLDRKAIHVRLLQPLSDFVIRPGDKNAVVTSLEWSPKKAISLTGCMGHLHMRGKSARLMMRYPDGKEVILASIPNYYYAWQVGSGLSFEKPIRVPANAKLYAECVYDNSETNPNNPDPSKEIHYGQTIDRTEMCHMSIGYLID